VKLLDEGARSLSIESTAGPVHERGDIERTIETFARQPAGGLLVLPDNFINANRELVVAMAEKYRLPALYPFRFFVKSGGLLSYGVDRPHPQGRQSRRTAGAAADPVRASDQHEDGQSARPHRAALVARPRRRGDRIEMLFAAAHESACGTNAKC